MQFSLKRLLFFTNGIALFAAGVFHFGWIALAPAIGIALGSFVYGFTGNWVWAILAGIVATFLLLIIATPTIH